MPGISFCFEPLQQPKTLASGEVHVLAADLDLLSGRVEKAFNALTEQERHRARRFRFQRDHDRFVSGRVLLRRLLQHYLGADVPGTADTLTFYSGPRGKPYLAPHGAPQPLWFNMSDASGCALFAFTKVGELGVDVEHQVPLPELTDIAENQLSALERQMLMALPAAEREPAFYRLWTRKEGYLKATGDGLHAPLAHFSVSCRSGDPPAILQIDGDPVAASRWQVYHLEPAPSFVGAVILDGTARRIVLGHLEGDLQI